MNKQEWLDSAVVMSKHPLYKNEPTTLEIGQKRFGVVRTSALPEVVVGEVTDIQDEYIKLKVLDASAPYVMEGAPKGLVGKEFKVTYSCLGLIFEGEADIFIRGLSPEDAALMWDNVKEGEPTNV